MPVETKPSATGQIEVAAPPDKVYALVSDPGALADCAEEFAGHEWLDGATSARVGARFRGTNRRGFRRWSTTCTISDADPGSRFAFEVTSVFGVPVARWQYDIEATSDGCRVTESTWERRPSWFHVIGGLATGVWERGEHNAANIRRTLEQLKARAEQT